MKMSRREEKEERQARAATDESMDPVAQQERTRMLSRSVPERGIRVTTPPSEDGGTVNNEIMGSDKSSSDGVHNSEHEE